MSDLADLLEIEKSFLSRRILAELKKREFEKHILSLQNFVESIIEVFNLGLMNFEKRGNRKKNVEKSISEAIKKAGEFNFSRELLLVVLEKYFFSVKLIIENSEFSENIKKQMTSKSREYFESMEISLSIEILNETGNSIKNEFAEESQNLPEASYDQIKSILEFLPDATFAIDMNKKVIAWNKRMEELTKIKKEEIIGKNEYEYAIPFYGEPCCTLIDFLNDTKCELEKERYTNFRRVGTTLYAETFAPNLYGGKGAYLWLNASVLYDGQKNRVGSIESIRDISHLKQAEEALKKSENRFRFLAENASDIIYLFKFFPERTLEYLSPSFDKITGYSSKDYGKDPSIVTKLIYPEHEDEIMKIADKYTDFFIPLTYKIYKKDGTVVWLEHLNHPVYENDKFVGIMGIARDITLRKQMEEKIRHMGFHDTLTGLYNRRYFEEQLEHSSAGRKYPIGLIIFDVNGLKFVNDSFGHPTGDKMLIAASDVLNNSFRKEDIIARIGGDEFAVLLTGCTKAIIEETLKRIETNLEKLDTANIKLPLSLSYGYALKMDKKMTASDFFREADDMMYKKKIHEQKSTRNSIINFLSDLIEKRKEANAVETEKAIKLTEAIADQLSFTPEHKDLLVLLARFHDVGYVTIENSLLTKPGTLSTEEIEEIRKHTETGYRISAVTSELNKISDWILKHHEWWNGKGYPAGLKETEIPLEARIIAVIAAFMSMTTDKPYRKAMRCEKAISEILSKVGTQFDPELVKKLIPILKEFCN